MMTDDDYEDSDDVTVMETSVFAKAITFGRSCYKQAVS